jgi:segregation and condensation protein B
MNAEQHIEALIFASEQSIRAEEIIYCLQSLFNQDFKENDLHQYLQNITDKYREDRFSIELVKLNNGYQFLTKKKYHPLISLLHSQRAKKKLSQAALETLAIIAYKQPVTKPDIEQIRGVNCDYSIQKLLEKDLISIIGKSEAVGKPILYGTGNVFADYFGINTISELPGIREFNDNNASIGE